MLELEFMRLALAVGVVVGILAPAVGFFLVERRQALVGDGLGHVAFAGVAAGYLIGVEPVLTAIAFAVVGSSSASSSGSAARARAMKARCCIPPESVRRGAPARSSRPTRAIRRSRSSSTRGSRSASCWSRAPAGST